MIHKAWVRRLIIFLVVSFFFVLIISIRQVLAPLFVALAIAYVGDPLVDRLEKLKIPRTWGIVVLIAAICLLLFGLSAYLVPKLAGQVRSLSEKLPVYWETASKKWQETMVEQDSAVKSFLTEHAAEVEEYKQEAVQWLKTHAGTLAQSIGATVATSFRSIGAFFANLLGLVIIPVLAFYLLRDFDIMNAKIAALIPTKNRALIVGLFREIDTALGNFIKGQLLVALILSCIYSIGLWIADCPAFLLIGVLAGFANLIPYLGLILGLVPAVLLTYLSGNPTWQVITAAVTFVIGQVLEGMVITPKVVGETVGLHPVMVLVGLTVAGTYFGFLGMILALPTCAVLMVLLRRAYLYYINSMFYHEDLGNPGLAAAGVPDGYTGPSPSAEADTPVAPATKPMLAEMRATGDQPGETIRTIGNGADVENRDLRAQVNARRVLEPPVQQVKPGPGMISRPDPKEDVPATAATAKKKPRKTTKTPAPKAQAKGTATKKKPTKPRTTPKTTK